MLMSFNLSLKRYSNCKLLCNLEVKVYDICGGETFYGKKKHYIRITK